MKLFRVVYKITALKLLAVSAVVVMAVYSRGNKSEHPNQKQKNYRQWWLKKVTSIIGLRLEIVGDVPDSKHSALWVANHISWLDIPVIGSAGSGFLSKAEVRKWPVIGWLGNKSGTVFIQRGGKNASQKASEEIAGKINAGENILVFPEGTTSLGNDVKSFYARVFAPALDHQLLVQPIAIQYYNHRGEYQSNLAWDDESFITNLLRVLGEPTIKVVITFLPMIDSSQYSQRKHIAELAESRIRGVIKMQEAG
jgi:1-acyl-sn-glycerol-3-phosphate acyltransferase